MPESTQKFDNPASINGTELKCDVVVESHQQDTL